jgi:hypothetical protein
MIDHAHHKIPMRQFAPLTWAVTNMRGLQVHTGRGLGFTYQVAGKVDGSGWVVLLDKEAVPTAAIFDEASAKEAAQADYDTRVAAALLPPGDPERADERAEIRNLISRLRETIDGFTRGAFTGWTGRTGSSAITLDGAEAHFSECMLDMMDAFDTEAAKAIGRADAPEDDSLRRAVVNDLYLSLEQELEAAGCLALTDEGLEAFKDVLIGGLSHGVGLSGLADPRAAFEAHVALKPFAAQAAYWPEKRDDDTLTTCDPAGDCCALDFTMGDLRRAAEIVAGQKAETTTPDKEPSNAR